MQVMIRHNTINKQADRRAKCGKPGGQQTVVEFSLVAISINAFMNDNE